MPARRKKMRVASPFLFYVVQPIISELSNAREFLEGYFLALTKMTNHIVQNGN